MIEKILTSIIQEFGPTGVLLIGVVFFGNLAYKKICNHLSTTNHILRDINATLQKLGEFWEYKMGSITKK